MKRSLCAMAVALGGLTAHAQLPEIYDVFPRAARPGEVLTILGQDFDPVATNNVVHIGGVRAKVRASWVSEMEVEVPEAAQEGTISLAAGGKIALSSIPFQPLFPPFGQTNVLYRRAAAVPSIPYVGIATADFNGDGGAELLCVNTQARVDIFEFVSGSRFISTNSLQLRAQLTGSSGINTNLMVADFDADGRIDVMLASGGSFDFFRNIHETGTLNEGSFAARVRTGRSGFQMMETELADVDRNGRLDVVVREPGGIWFHLNIADPSSTNGWLEARRPVTPGNLLIRDMAIGDLNQDGHVDVVVAVSEAVPSVRIFSHNSRSETTNTFTQISISGTGTAGNVELFDVEGDGLLDILTYDATTGIYEVLQNRNQGGRLEPADFEVVRLVQREQPQQSQLTPKILDVNGDGFDDIVRGSTTFGSNPGVYYENQSRFLGDVVFAGSFLSKTNILTNATSIVTVDLNRDGAQDAIALQVGVTVYQNMIAERAEVAGIYVFGAPTIFAVAIIGRPGEVVTLQSSSGLTAWATVATTRIGATGLWYYNSEATNKYRFFRVRPSP